MARMLSRMTSICLQKSPFFSGTNRPWCWPSSVHRSLSDRVHSLPTLWRFWCRRAAVQRSSLVSWREQGGGCFWLFATDRQQAQSARPSSRPLGARHMRPQTTTGGWGDVGGPQPSLGPPWNGLLARSVGLRLSSASTINKTVHFSSISVYMGQGGSGLLSQHDFPLLVHLVPGQHRLVLSSAGTFAPQDPLQVLAA